MARWDSARRALLTVASLSALASAASMTTSAGGGIMMPPPPPPPHPRDDDDVARIVPRPRPPRRALLLSSPDASASASASASPPPPPVVTASVSTLADLRLHVSRDSPTTRVELAANVDLSLDALGELPPVEKALVITGAACASDPALGANCAVSAGSLSRHFTVGATGALTLEDLTLRLGAATGLPWGDGGSVFAYGHLAAVRVAFEANAATLDGVGRGGAVALLDASARFEDCLFLANAASGDGGAVFVSSGDATFIRCSFERNDAKGLGAGVAVDRGVAVVRACVFAADNTAREANARDVHVAAPGGVELEPFEVWDEEKDAFEDATKYRVAGLGSVERASAVEGAPEDAFGGEGDDLPEEDAPIDDSDEDAPIDSDERDASDERDDASSSSASAAATFGGAFAALGAMSAWACVAARRHRVRRPTESEEEAKARADEAVRAAREKRLRAEERSAVANRAKERAAKLKGGDKARDRGRSDRRRRRNRMREGGEGGGQGGGADDGGTPDRPSGIAGDFDGVEEFDDIGATSAGGVEYDDGGGGDGGDGIVHANENGRGGGERSRYRPSYFGGSDRGSDDDSARSARLGEGGSPGDSGYSDDGHAFSGVGGVRSPRRPPEANRRRFVFGEASEAVFPDAFARGGEAAAAEADRARERRPPSARAAIGLSFPPPAGAPEERGTGDAAAPAADGSPPPPPPPPPPPARTTLGPSFTLGPANARAGSNARAARLDPRARARRATEAAPRGGATGGHFHFRR